MSKAATTAWISYESAGKTIRVELNRPKTVFGRDPTCDVVLNWNAASRKHFAVLREGDQWTIEDLESRNGTFVNKLRVTRQGLINGDRINIGRQTLVPITLSFYVEIPTSPSIDENVFLDDGGGEESPRAVAAHISVDNVQVRPSARAAVHEDVAADHEVQLGAEAPAPGEAPIGAGSAGLINMFSQVGDVLLHSASLKDTLQRVLDLAFDNLPAHRGAICLYDPATSAVEPKASRRGKSTAAISISRHVAQQVIANKRAILVNDVGGDARFSQSQSIAQMNISSVMCAPMVHRGEVQGIIYVDTTGGDEGFISEPFEKQHLETLAAIGVLAAAAIEKIKLQKGIELLLQVARSLSSELNMDKLVHLIIDHAREFLDAEVGRLYLVDKERGELYSKVPDGVDRIIMPLSEGLAGHVASTGISLNVAQAQRDPRFNAAIDKASGVTTNSVLCIPLRDREGEIFGVAELLNKRGGPFDDTDQQMMEAFSAQAAVALQNSMLFNETVEVRNHLESVMKSINHLVVTLNFAGRLETSNFPLTPLLGVDQRVLQEQPYDKWFEGTNAELVGNIQRVFKTGRPIYVPDYQITRPGGTSSVNYNVVPLLDVDETQIGVVMVFDDITENKRLAGNLSRHLGPAVAQKVMEEGEEQLGGVRQVVTTLFSDIRGYTALTEALDATEVVAMLNEYFTAMVDVIFAADGVLDKFIGDAIMATFGAPFPSDDDPHNACLCALGMRDALQALNARRHAADLRPIVTGVGINTGEAISGNIGSEKQFEYTCIGDCVNLSSRLEGVTKTYQVPILISESTYAAAGHTFITRELDIIRVKGKQVPIRIYELLGRDDQDVAEELMQALPLFDQGLRAYRAGAFEAAETHFAAVHEIVPDDGPTNLFIQRCRAFGETPPPAGWNGVFEMTTK